MCLGAGGGLSAVSGRIKNGKATFFDGDDGASALALLRGLNLFTDSGTAFDPTSYDQVKSWLGGRTAVKMAYILSVQLAAVELSVMRGFVDPDSPVFAPGVAGSNNGFTTIQAVMDEANTNLALPGHNYTVSDSPYRIYQEILKIALENANKNVTFVQPAACAFSFASE